MDQRNASSAFNACTVGLTLSLAVWRQTWAWPWAVPCGPPSGGSAPQRKRGTPSPPCWPDRPSPWPRSLRRERERKVNDLSTLTQFWEFGTIWGWCVPLNTVGPQYNDPDPCYNEPSPLNTVGPQYNDLDPCYNEPSSLNTVGPHFNSYDLLLGPQYNDYKRLPERVCP